jgi:hypothetical protein
MRRKIWPSCGGDTSTVPVKKRPLRAILGESRSLSALQVAEDLSHHYDGA